MHLMQFTGPLRYSLTFDARSFTVTCPGGTPKFSGLATSKFPKLYIVSRDNWPIYVGITKRPMRDRLRVGWNADGSHGYHGYAWRHQCVDATLDIWVHEDPKATPPELDVETIEAELVYLIRQAGQWPQFQTEIHFHPSDAVHREMAKRIMGQYEAVACGQTRSRRKLVSRVT